MDQNQKDQNEMGSGGGEMSSSDGTTGTSTSVQNDANPVVPKPEGQSAQQEYADMKAANEADEYSEHKTFAILGYILPFLFFLPLMNETSKNNKFARFHANQQLILLVATIGLYFVHSMLFMSLFMTGLYIGQLINLAFLVLVIIGVINASQGKMKELPLIGGFKLLK